MVKKYSYKIRPGLIDIPVGEYDVPEQQKQSLLTVPISAKGNTLVYGAPGSGKENFIMTLVYEAMNLYTPEDINFYIMDFGAEILKIFEPSVYVGDVVQIDEEEKIVNLYKMLNSMMEQRKNLFSNYGGNFFNYNAKSGSKVPSIVVILNNFEAYQDTYEEYEDTLNVLTRECSKYGIYFIATCNTPNGMRFKIKQNFSQIYCLQQNNEDDYSTILGNVNKSYPSKLFGRGIIKAENVYEFQTASIDTQDKTNDLIEAKIKEDKSKYKVKAKNIPILPEIVNYESVEDSLNANSMDTIIGIEKKSLDVSSYNFTKNLINVITANEPSIMNDFTNAFISQLKTKTVFQTMVVDAGEMDINESTKSGVVYEETDYNGIFEKILKYETDCYDLYVNNNYNANVLRNQKKVLFVINCIDGFKSKLTLENQNKINDFFSKAKDLGIINFILIDSIDKIKKVEYETWFKDGFNAADGIWIGDGINDQFTLKVSVRTDEVRESTEDEFCFVLKRCKPVLVKYLSDFTSELDEEDEMLELD